MGIASFLDTNIKRTKGNFVFSLFLLAYKLEEEKVILGDSSWVHLDL